MRCGLPAGEYARIGHHRIRALRSGRPVLVQQSISTRSRMMAASMQVKLVQTGPVKFVATNATSATAVIDGPADMGGENTGLRPMETLLSALASCSAVDVIHIMKKQRQSLERL